MNPEWTAFIIGLLLGGTVTATAMALWIQSGNKLLIAGFYADKSQDLHTFLFDVAAEVLRARRKHPGNKHLNVALMEEVGELAKEFLENGTKDRKWSEAVQVACVAARIATEGDSDYE